MTPTKILALVLELAGTVLLALAGFLVAPALGCAVAGLGLVVCGAAVEMPLLRASGER